MRNIIKRVDVRRLSRQINFIVYVSKSGYASQGQCSVFVCCRICQVEYAISFFDLCMRAPDAFLFYYVFAFTQARGVDNMKRHSVYLNMFA